jgi:hypothetical protein
MRYRTDSESIEDPKKAFKEHKAGITSRQGRPGHGTAGENAHFLGPLKEAA